MTRRSIGIALGLIALAGCSESVLQGSLTAGNPTRVNAQIEVVSADAARPDLVDFGAVSLGETAVAEVRVRSVGTDTLQLQDFSISEPTVTLVWLEPQGLLLAPGEEALARLEWEIAGLRIIFVSDAVDFSTDAGMPFQTAAGYVQAFQGLKDDPSKVILSDISGGRTGCSGPGGSAQGSTNLNTATTMTGGISASICDANWVASLSALAWLSTTVNDTFLLSEPAIEDTIEVHMNGSFVPSGWFYDSALNAIVFYGSYIPDEGDDLLVSYAIDGGCQG